MGIRIRVERLHKSYTKGPEKIHVLKGIDLEVPSGHRLAITGVSGTGKSTLLHILGALERPTSGTVRHDDQDVFSGSEQALAEIRNRTIGFVFQFHHLLEEFSALENAAVPLMIRGETRIDALAAAERHLARVGLTHRADHRPNQLSGGEQQRVAIARALAGEPPLLLMDEPTGNLDTSTADDIHRLILDVVEETAATLVLVTHNEELADMMGERRHLQDGCMTA